MIRGISLGTVRGMGRESFLRGKEGKRNGREVGHPFMSLQGERNATSSSHRPAASCPGMNEGSTW